MGRIEVEDGYRLLLMEAGKGGFVKEAMRELCKRDLYFLLTRVLHREDARCDFVFGRCREVQADPNGYLDLWFREGYKSTIITFALTIQDILNNPEITVCILSFNRPIAKQFLRQIKREFENNQELLFLFDDVLWKNPQKEAPKWSEDDGIYVIRKGNPKEATVEAWGLVDGQPTSKHFSHRIYDDPVTRESVTTPDMIAKVTKAWELSINLGSSQGINVERYIGTRYHYADLYSVLIERKVVVPRVYTPTVDGTLEGNVVIWTKAILAEKIKAMGPATAAAQLFQNPKHGTSMGFNADWLRYWPADKLKGLNLYLLCDPACEKKIGSDYTVFVIIGLGSDENYYVVDIIRDRLGLTEKGNILFSLHQKYRPRAVGYEKYGMQSDIQYFSDKMTRENYRFSITELGGQIPKIDRISRMIPYFFSGRIYIPESTPHRIHTGETVDTIKSFINEEYTGFPFTSHDDALDCMARILDEKLGAVFPRMGEDEALEMAKKTIYNPLRYGLGDNSLRTR